MFSNRLGFAILGAACIAAAGAGGYVASRQNVVTPAPVAAAPVSAAPAQTQPVQETEALVGDTARSAVTAPEVAAPPSAPASVRRSDPAPQAQASKPARRPEAVSARNTQTPTLDRSWPSSAPASQSEPPVNAPPVETSAPHQEETRAAEPPVVAPPPSKSFEELVVASNSVLGLQMATTVSSDRAKVEDRVEARVVRDVRVGGQVAIPAGSHAIGVVTAVDHGGKFKDAARLGIRFHTLVMADGAEMPISTDTIYRYGEPPSNGSAAKVGGGAVAGAILGAIIGGAKGAAIGGAAGAGAGTAVVMAGDAKSATFPAGTEVTARFLSPVTVTVEK